MLTYLVVFAASVRVVDVVRVAAAFSLTPQHVQNKDDKQRDQRTSDDAHKKSQRRQSVLIYHLADDYRNVINWNMDRNLNVSKFTRKLILNHKVKAFRGNMYNLYRKRSAFHQICQETVIFCLT